VPTLSLQTALHALRAAHTDLIAAHAHVLVATNHLTGARHTRAVELGELIDDAAAFTTRLAFITEGDLRAEAADNDA
jgi:hypothetical protein